MRPEPQNKSVSDSEFDREIAALLDVNPSPGFAPRVRARIASAPAPSPWRFGWTALAAGAMTAAIVLALSISRPHENLQPAVPQPLQAESMLTDLPPVAPSASAPVARVSKVSAPVIREPLVLFSADETASLQRLLSRGPIQWTEVSVVTIEPQPLPELNVAPIPLFEPKSMEPSKLMALPKGDTQ